MQCGANYPIAVRLMIILGFPALSWIAILAILGGIWKLSAAPYH